MEIDALNFSHQLLGILTNIAEADFVAIDLEFTGLPSRLPGKSTTRSRQTLEDRYAETKTAAERYHILQVGLTCGRFDPLEDRYVLRPYNILLSPLLDERLDMEREVSIQSGAASFLLNHDFDLAAPFTRGVQYLSRWEATQAKDTAYARLAKDHIDDLQLTEKDVDSIDFVKRVREAILEWKADRCSGSLEITTHTGLAGTSPTAAISRFEKRLVHQLVRAEFEDFVSIGRNDCVRLIPRDDEKEAENTRRQKVRVKEAIARQTGFRWVFEALTGGDIHRLDPFYYGTNVRIMAADSTDIRGRFRRVEDRLARHQPVLVGHNMFTDLVYFYRTFVGTLPDTLPDFCAELHEAFPWIIDTKYLATYAGGDLHASPSLQDIAETLAAQELPKIVTHSSHDKYHNREAFHEAGYDSLLTATIMLRLSSRIDAGRCADGVDAPHHTETSSDASFRTAVEAQPEVRDKDSLQSRGKGPATAVTASAKSLAHRSANSVGLSQQPSSSKTPRFHTPNVFDSLRDLDPEITIDRSSKASSHNQPLPASPSLRAPPDSGHAITPMVRMQRKPMEMLPSLDPDSPFWHEFGNTLRVYGTKETVLKLGEWQ